MKFNRLILCVAVFIYSCHHQPASVQQKVVDVQQHSYLNVKPPPPETALDTVAIVIDSTNLLLVQQIKHTFSDPMHQDSFSVALYGSSISTGNIIFKITNFRHKELYKHVLFVEDLLADQADRLTARQKADTIRKWMLHFFDANQFRQPAIGKDEKIEEDLDNRTAEDESNWNAVKSDPAAVAFAYQSGYESIYVIAYAKKKKKVVGIAYSD